VVDAFSLFAARFWWYVRQPGRNIPAGGAQAIHAAPGAARPGLPSPPDRASFQLRRREDDRGDPAGPADARFVVSFPEMS
jgi:hypothetical protein